MAKFTIEVEPVADDSELRSGEPDTAPKEKPPMTDAKPRLFTIHLVDRSAMPDAPPDPTPAIVQGMVDTVNREIEHGISAAKKIVDATIARANDAEREIADLRRQLSDALAAVEEWRGLATCREEQLRLLHQDYAGCVGERDAAREESAARDTVAAEIRRQLFEALEDVREWKDAARKTEMTCASVDSIKSERDAARAELRAAREKHAESLCRLIDERDEARKALADEVARGQNIGIAGCNLKAGSHVVWMDSAELAALRARVAELEMERGWSLGVKKFVTADGTQYSVAEYVELMRARVAELEKTIEAAKVNPMTLFGNHSITGRTHAIDRNRSFVGVIVDVSGGKRAHVEALKHIASWL